MPSSYAFNSPCSTLFYHTLSIPFHYPQVNGYFYPLSLPSFSYPFNSPYYTLFHYPLSIHPFTILSPPPFTTPFHYPQVNGYFCSLVARNMANVYVNLRPTSFNVPLDAPLSASTDPIHNGGGGNVFGSNGGVNGASEEKEIQSELLVSPQVTPLVYTSYHSPLTPGISPGNPPSLFFIYDPPYPYQSIFTLYIPL